MKPAERRMGSSKGSPEYWVSVIRPGQIIYELSGVPKEIAEVAMLMAAHKMPIATRLVTSNKL
ncbi:hypothetical protein L7F22_012310 [Adiantum nelumboides]|nr:hypothetical protein [Adiantum nelumboides]